MRYAILGDVHANWEALDTVLGAVKTHGVDKKVCVGDLVGYGAEPGRCIDRLREEGVSVVAGNHDHAVIGRLDIEYFNPFAKVSTLWTREQLTGGQREYLAGLPMVHEEKHLMVAHGSVHEPDAFHYIQSLHDASRSLTLLSRPVCFLGHSHIPVSFFDGEEITYALDPQTPIDPEARTLVNVGAIGQPRDEDPRAAYAIYDTDEKAVHLHRVEYNIEGAIEKILAAGLPEILAERLRFGR
jgi:diadenosine tetraphosphatase ApaH/serine/threonine PP2A family protein phosphatase